MSYALIKTIHVGCVLLSFSLFFIRGIWMLNAPDRLRLRWVRILPHVIDTTLLVSAIALAAMSRQYPLADGWLTAKVIALLVYIALGFVALRFGRTRPVRIAAWLAALAVFAYIVAVAYTRSPWLTLA